MQQLPSFGFSPEDAKKLRDEMEKTARAVKALIDAINRNTKTTDKP